MKEMRTRPGAARRRAGRLRARRGPHPLEPVGQRPDLFNHGGGGYGFLSDLWWLPQLRIGVAMLTNSHDHDLQGTSRCRSSADLVTEPGIYRDRLLALPSRPPVVEPSGFEPPAGMADLVAGAAMAPTGDQAVRWAGYSGAYRAPEWDVIDPFDPPERFLVETGVPYFERGGDETESLVRHRLVEVATRRLPRRQRRDARPERPRADVAGTPTRPGDRGPAPWQWGVLGTAALAAAAWLVAAAIRAVRRRARRTSYQRPSASRAGAGSPHSRRSSRRSLMLGNAACSSGARLVDSGFLGWLELPMAQRLVCTCRWR